MDNEAENSDDEQREVEEKTKRVNTVHIILAWLSLLPILVWPWVSASFMWILAIGKSPSGILSWILFFGVNIYPLYLIGNATLSRRLFRHGKLRSSFILTLWPLVVLILLMFLWGFALI